MAELWISIDTGDAKHLAEELRKLARGGVAYAVRNTLNDLAFEAREQWRREMEERFVLRNKWTIGSLRVDRATGTLVEAMESRVGSLAEYMGLQEAGGTKSGSGKHGVRIPTSAASGEGVGTVPRRRVVAARFRMKAINLGHKSVAHFETKRQRIAVSVAMAAREGVRFVFLDTSGGAGYYLLRGPKRHPKMRRIWNLDHGSVRVPATPTLAAATDKAVHDLGKFATSRIREQLRRAGFEVG